MNVGIVGLGNMGRFHSREFVELGENVSAILGRTDLKTKEALKYLKKNYDIDARGYSSLQKFLSKEKLDVVSICSPANTHYYLMKDILNQGLHIFCEKPFTGSLKETKEILDIAERKKLVVTLNTQWPSVLPKLRIPSKINYFEMKMQPGTFGKDMIYDHLPHMVSMLVKLCGEGRVEKVNFLRKSEKEAIIEFKYIKEEKVKVVFKFEHKADRPRNVEFKINDIEFKRLIGENYSQSILISGKEKIAIEDPLKVSIKMFINAVKNKTEPLITNKEILEISKIQERILDGF